MSWKKYFTPIDATNSPDGGYSAMGGRSAASGVGPARSNYSSFLPDAFSTAKLPPKTIISAIETPVS